MSNDDNLRNREEFYHPKLTEEQDKEQRGDDPSTVRHDPKPQAPERDPSKEERRKKAKAFIDRWIMEKGRVRQEGLWPYLLIRAVPGDHGVRPLTVPFWESPDIIVVPGIVDTYDGVSATLNPQVSVPHTIFVHVWNLGRLPAIGVKLRVYWADPSFSFDDPLHPPHLIGSMYLNLPDRQNPDCHQLFRLPAPWTPVVENNGHECLLAKVDCFADGAGSGFNANANRHVGQRNLILAPAALALTPLLRTLGRNLPIGADLQLLHGMYDLYPTLLVHQPNFLGQLVAPAALPNIAFELPGGFGHLGAILRAAPNVDRVIPASVAGPVFRPERLDTAVIEHPRVREITKSREPVVTIVRNLGIRNLTAKNLAERLGSRTDEGHMLRFQAVKDGRVVGGYTIIVQNKTTEVMV